MALSLPKGLEKGEEGGGQLAEGRVAWPQHGLGGWGSPESLGPGP